MTPSRIFLFLLLATVLAGCLPASLQDDRPDAAVIGVPVEVRVPGAADALQDRLAAMPTGHDLVSAARVRFLETRSALAGGSVDRGAARVARRTGAEVAVTVGAIRLERDLAARFERVALQLEASVIRAEDAAVLARFRGPRLRASDGIAGTELPALADDRLVAELVERSLDELAPRIAARLAASEVSGSSAE